MLAAPCGVRAHAIRKLEQAKISWTEAFTGVGVTAITAAVRRVAPAGTADVGPALSLPSLGRSKVMLHSRVSDARARAALRAMAAAFRGGTSK